MSFSERREPYQELGADHLRQRRSQEGYRRVLVRQLEKLGSHRVVLEALPQPA